ncbi:MAG: TatD family hydrolase [Smithellaceae bacterium]|jgi:TatD DNase family protein|nr:TatD family hydrolase [Smithellaceae bacterium]MDD3258144.1 TatD family hydrolase [Smithellaceae bacterium]MDD3848651.1 TatD family hydrolase [Smithellaceae bacterium]HOG11590.1 TatD family hydrolase [Smithellaceae bacterium]HPL09231.1 TatD family hydrolase [Smithellaceae bacterium]
MLIDSHAHLEMKEFDPDRSDVIERARAAGVDCIVTVGTNPALSRKALSIARRHENIYSTVGIHPHDAAAADDSSLDELKKLAQDPKVVAYGEIGLDYFRDLSPREKQAEMFARQLDLAGELRLPVIIHDREAHEQTLRMVKASGIRSGVFHCFSGDWSMARQCLDLGFYLSVPGVVTFDRSKVLQEVVRQAPMDWLLLETDCPYLAPVPHRGKRNEPSFLVHTARKVAQIKGLAWEDVAQTAARNACRLFCIPPPALK